jgi:hypothetical protein
MIGQNYHYHKLSQIAQSVGLVTLETSYLNGGIGRGDQAGCTATSPYHGPDTELPGRHGAEALMERFTEALMQRSALGVITPRV